MTSADAFITRVRQALGRDSAAVPPPPPQLDERLIRTLAADENLAARFQSQAQAAGLEVSRSETERLADHLLAMLRDAGCKSAALPRSTLLDTLQIADRLRDAGIDARAWDQLQADDLFDIDVGITDCFAAIAETGSVVIRANPDHGRGLSLVPPLHIAIVQPRDLVADLLDALRRLKEVGVGSGAVIITGPSKTTDIEGNLVIGVHGPGRVHTILVE